MAASDDDGPRKHDAKPAVELVRAARAALLVVVAVLSAVTAWGPLHWVFESDRDGTVLGYVLSSLPFLAVTALCAVGAARLLRR